MLRDGGGGSCPSEAASFATWGTMRGGRGCPARRRPSRAVAPNCCWEQALLLDDDDLLHRLVYLRASLRLRGCFRLAVREQGGHGVLHLGAVHMLSALAEFRLTGRGAAATVTAATANSRPGGSFDRGHERLHVGTVQHGAHVSAAASLAAGEGPDAGGSRSDVQCLVTITHVRSRPIGTRLRRQGLDRPRAAYGSNPSRYVQHAIGH